MTVKFIPPKINPAVRVAAAVETTELLMAKKLLEASLPGVPVEQGTLYESGRVVPTEHGVAVTFGADDDGDESHAPSNHYVLRQHEDETLAHPNGGHAHWLSTAMHTSRREVATVAAVSLRKALQ